MSAGEFERDYDASSIRLYLPFEGHGSVAAEALGGDLVALAGMDTSARRPIDLGRVESALAAHGLGEEVSPLGGGHGTVHEVPGDPDLIIKVPSDPNDRSLVTEFDTMERLRAIGLPTPHHALVSWSEGGVQRSGLLMDKIDGFDLLYVQHDIATDWPAESSTLFQTTGQFDQSPEATFQLPWRAVNQHTVEELERFRDTLDSNHVAVKEFQVMVSPDGAPTIIDGAAGHLEYTEQSLSDRRVADTVSRFHSRMDLLIMIAKALAAENAAW